jgi:hypothetical protein
MYDLLDRPVADLPAEDCARLRAIRDWVHALTLAGHASPGSSDTAFDAALRLLDAHSTGTLEFQRPCHVTVEETEAVVLGLWRLVAADRLPAALATARSLVGDAAGAFVAAVQRTV